MRAALPGIKGLMNRGGPPGQTTGIPVQVMMTYQMALLSLYYLRVELFLVNAGAQSVQYDWPRRVNNLSPDFLKTWEVIKQHGAWSRS